MLYFCVIFVVKNSCIFSFLRLILYSTKKRETQNVELISSQMDHKRRTSFVYIGLKVCQLLLHCKSFATRGQKWAINQGGSNCKVREDKRFIMLFSWISSSNWNRLSRPNGTQTLIPGKFFFFISSYVIIERLVARVVLLSFG